MNSNEEVLYRCCERGETNKVRRLLSTFPKMDINWSNPKSNWTILIVSIIEGHSDVVRLVLKHPGIDVNKFNRCDRGRWTPLHHASYYGRIKIVRMLLQHRTINYRAKDRYGKRPYDRARIKDVKNIIQQHKVRALYVDKNRKKFNRYLDKLRKIRSSTSIRKNSKQIQKAYSTASDDIVQMRKHRKDPDRRKQLFTPSEGHPPSVNLRRKLKKKMKKEEEKEKKARKSPQKGVRRTNEEFEALLSRLKELEEVIEKKDEVIERKDIMIETQNNRIKVLRDELNQLANFIKRDN